MNRVESKRDRQRRYEQRKSVCRRNAIASSHPDRLSYFTVTQVG